MPNNFRKWAIGIVAFLLSFSFAVNVHCVILLFRYRQIYLRPPVWVAEGGEYSELAQTMANSEDATLPADIKFSEDSEDESVKTQLSQDSQEDSKLLESADKSETTVYLTKSGSKFHRDGCSSLSKSKIPISYGDAVTRGFEPCGRCNP